MLGNRATPGQRVDADPTPRLGLAAYMKRRALTPPDVKLHIGRRHRP
jgi:hypothetical protein